MTSSSANFCTLELWQCSCLPSVHYIYNYHIEFNGKNTFLSLPYIYFQNQIRIAILMVTQYIVSWNPTNDKISAKNWIRLCSPVRDDSSEISSVSKNDAMISVKHAAYASFGNSKCTILTWFYVARGTWICFIRILRAISLPEASSFPTVSEGCLWNIEITLLHPVERQRYVAARKILHKYSGFSYWGTNICNIIWNLSYPLSFSVIHYHFKSIDNKKIVKS